LADRNILYLTPKGTSPAREGAQPGVSDTSPTPTADGQTPRQSDAPLLGESLNGKTTAEFNPNKTYGTVTDIDGNVYRTITIGAQTWMAENLRTTRYRNGDAIPEVTGDATWTGTKSGAYCNWENTRDVHSIATFGRIYNWYAATDSRNIAPDGWHVSSDEEWATLTRYLGGESVAGGKLREAGTTHWESNPYGTNESGFTALPGGVRGAGAKFIDARNNGTWFSSTEATSASAWYWAMYYGANEVYRGDSGKEGSGFYVRCVRD
jgi:uncharacterized protein (TIGR02145 family)